MKVTINDIAKLAGVSVATVSRVVNNKGKGFSEETRKKIWDIIEQYDYQPSAVARGLVTGRSKIVGLIIPDISNPFFPKMAKGVEDCATERGYNMILCEGGNDADKEASYMTFLTEHYVSGIIYHNYNQIYPSTHEKLVNTSLPTVFFDTDAETPRSGNVSVDNRKAMSEMVKYLYSQGHRSIAFVGGPEDSHPTIGRLEGYKAAFEELGLWYDERIVIFGDFTIEAGYKSAKELFAKNIGFTAIASGGDSIAIGIYDACEEVGRRIPEDISVTGFDNIDMSRFLKPKLTTVNQPSYEMGYESCNMLLDIIEGKQKKSREIKVFDTELKIRDSVKKLINYDCS